MWRTAGTRPLVVRIRSSACSDVPARWDFVGGGADRIGAARYRARKRGEPVAKRKPGPKAQKITEMRTDISGLQTRFSEWRV
jgi:hypothetical protein